MNTITTNNASQDNIFDIDFKCPTKDKIKFFKSKCLLTISVGQIEHEGDMFFETIQLIGHSFKECIISVCDTLQRHTIKINSNNVQEKDLYQVSKERGDQWLRDNQLALNQLKIPHEIIRWDNWLQHPLYNDMLDKVTQLYKDDPSYRLIVDETISAFVSRTKKRYNGFEFNESEALVLSLRYILEESAAMLLYVDTNCEYEVYPYKRVKALRATYDRFVKNDLVGRLAPVSLIIKKIGV